MQKLCIFEGYNENVLEYAQIARSEPKSMIRDIEALSNVHCTCMHFSWLSKVNITKIGICIILIAAMSNFLIVKSVKII